MFFAVPEVEDELSPVTEIDGHATGKARLRGVDPIELLELPWPAASMPGSDELTRRTACMASPLVLNFG